MGKVFFLSFVGVLAFASQAYPQYYEEPVESHSLKINKGAQLVGKMDTCYDGIISDWVECFYYWKKNEAGNSECFAALYYPNDIDHYTDSEATYNYSIPQRASKSECMSALPTTEYTLKNDKNGAETCYRIDSTTKGKNFSQLVSTWGEECLKLKYPTCTSIIPNWVKDISQKFESQPAK